jgi:N-methylhydantoinase B
MDELHDYSERLVRPRSRAPGRPLRGRDALEPRAEASWSPRAVTIDGDELEIDFAGTAAQHDGNLNCPLAVTRSACYFVVRCLTDPDVPASAGLRAGAGARPRARS